MNDHGDVRNKELVRSFKANFLGPYKVYEKVSDVNYRVELPPSSRRDDLFHISQLKLKKRLPDSYDGPLPVAAAAQIFKKYKNDDIEMELVDILQHKKKAKGFIMEVQFLDSSTEWVTMSSLKKTAPRLLADYLSSHSLT